MQEKNSSSNQLVDHQQLQVLFDFAIIPTKSIDKSGTIVFANNAELTSLGYSDYIGRSFREFFADKSEYDLVTSILAEGKELNNYEALICSVNGEVNHWLMSSMTRTDSQGQSLTYIFSRDITAFKRTQELLGYLNKAGEELASALDTETALNKVSNLVVPRFANWFAIDVLKDGRIESLIVQHADPDQIKWAEDYRKNNPQDLSDTTSGVVVVLTTGNPILVPEVTDEMLAAAIKEPDRLELFRSMNLRSAIIVPMFASEEIKGAATFITTGKGRKYDETDLQFAKDFANRVGLTLENARLYENANKEIKQRIEAEKKKDEFISIASHELKTPLTSIKAYLQLLQKTLDQENRSYGFLLKANDHVSRLERLISDLLDASKIEAGKMGYQLEKFNFNELLAESVESAQHISPQHTIKIIKSADVAVSADRLRLEQVLNNFLSNAIKYSPGQNEVLVSSWVEQSNLIVSIQDFGIGIERENMGSLFERFYRVDNTAMKFQGLGLGLYIAAEILKRHNGSFWIESEPGKGSKFFFLLPLEEKEKKEADTNNSTYYRDNLITIELNQEKKWIEVDWTGFQNFESVKHGCLVMHKLLKKNKCSKVLNDNTHVQGNWSEAVDWGGEVWFPMMEKAGTKYFAWIYSPSTFSQLSAEKSIDIMQGNIIARFFTNREEAAEWLESVE